MLSLFDLVCFNIFRIISLFNQLFFHIFQIISLFSSIFSLSFHYFLLYLPNPFTIRLTYLPYFPKYFTIQLILLLPYFSMLTSYQKQALTVIISPLCTNCHDITVILLNVALNTINLTFYLQRHIPTYLSIYIFIRLIDCIKFLDEFQISTIKFILQNSLT
jgi:hypothetical protein